jgi:hypothetical protein
MLQITADIFSGRSNPTWVVADEAEARATLSELVKNRGLLADTSPSAAGLGFRGFWIDVLSDELTQDFGLGPSIYLAAGPQAVNTRANELAERLVALMSRGEPAPGAAEDALPLETSLQTFLTTQLERTSRVSLTDTGEAPGPAGEDAVAAAAVCTIELGAFNPGFWNNDPNIRSRNNCYNYASNKRTDTFAQPGRGCGSMYTSITCAEVTRAALCDRLHRRYDCFPDSEKPRYLVALVVAPGPGFIDYHWYRKHKEGFWGHKPGGTAARNIDNSGRVILDPQTCDRGPYTHFCGFFYTCRSQLIR